jgi:cyclophilin family peptidyl-prolyl cis-trans isomerase/HEAT repeat protein
VSVLGVACGGAAADLQGFMKEADGTRLRALTQYLADHRAGTGALMTLSRHTDPGVRSSALIAMAQNDDPKSVPAIVHALNDVRHEVRQHAVFALGQLGGEQAQRGLLQAIGRERQPAVRFAIWRALGRIGDAAALPSMRAAPRAERPRTIQAAAHVLRRLERPAWDEPFIRRALESTDPQARAASLYAMHRAPMTPPQWVRDRAVVGLRSAAAGERDAAVRVLRKGSEGVEEAVRNAWASGVLTAHQRAALAAGVVNTKGQEATHTLVVIARSEALRLLGKGNLIRAAYHPMITAVKGLAGRPLSPVDRRELKDLALAVRERTFSASIPARLRKQRLRCALELLQGSLEACTDLERVGVMGRPNGDAEAIRTYITHPSPSVRMAALTALAKVGTDMRADIVEALTDKDLPVVATAASLAKKQKLRGGDVLEVLARAWRRAFAAQDVEVALDVLHALDALDAPGLDKALEKARHSGVLGLAKAATVIAGKRSGSPPEIPRATTALFNVEDVAPYRRSQGPTHAVVETSIGSFTMKLRSDWAPRTVSNFVNLARRDYFSGLSFHRVVPYFVAQGGDPRDDGWGGPGYTIRCENNPLPYRTGAVGMALAGKDTGGSQWFVTHVPQPHLFGNYPVFAQVVEGQTVVDRLVPGDRIRHIGLEGRAE